MKSFQMNHFHRHRIHQQQEDVQEGMHWVEREVLQVEEEGLNQKLKTPLAKGRKKEHWNQLSVPINRDTRNALWDFMGFVFIGKFRFIIAS